jgi:twitching motility protein PilT
MTVARSLGGPTIAVQILPNRVLYSDQVGLPDAVREALLSGWGLVIFSGPIGSGKVTTAYAALEVINRNCDCHICTVEDPVCVQIPSKRAMIQQREIGVDVPDCISGIRAALRQDLDVLFVNETKGIEDLQACITAAEMGHLVIMILHAPRPEDAIRRIMEVFPQEIRTPSRHALARCLRVVVAQRLARRVDGGRIALYGVLIPDDEMRHAIEAGEDFMRRKSPIPEGCQTLEEHAERLVQEGVISQEAAADA